jgi:hypothetical protein
VSSTSHASRAPSPSSSAERLRRELDDLRGAKRTFVDPTIASNIATSATSIGASLAARSRSEMPLRVARRTFRELPAPMASVPLGHADPACLRHPGETSTQPRGTYVALATMMTRFVIATFTLALGCTTTVEPDDEPGPPSFQCATEWASPAIAGACRGNVGGLQLERDQVVCADGKTVWSLDTRELDGAPVAYGYDPDPKGDQLCRPIPCLEVATTACATP